MRHAGCTGMRCRPFTHFGCVPRQFVAHGPILSRFGASRKAGAIHTSLVQALVDKIEVRFALFVLSTLPLFVLTWRAARIIWD